MRASAAAAPVASRGHPAVRPLCPPRARTVQSMGLFSSLFGAGVKTAGCPKAPAEAPPGLKLATFAGEPPPPRCGSSVRHGSHTLGSGAFVRDHGVVPLEGPCPGRPGAPCCAGDAHPCQRYCQLSCRGGGELHDPTPHHHLPWPRNPPHALGPHMTHMTPPTLSITNTQAAASGAWSWPSSASPAWSPPPWATRAAPTPPRRTTRCAAATRATPRQCRCGALMAHAL